MKLKGVFFVLSIFLVSSLFADIRAVTPDQWGAKPSSWQMERHDRFLKNIEAGVGDVVFIGDSITQRWENKKSWKDNFTSGPRKALNLGISADRTEHVIWRITQGRELDGYEAKVIVLLIGTNNTGHNAFEKEPPIDTILGIKKILGIIKEKQPKARILLTAIYPRGASDNDPNRIRNEVVNNGIEEFCDGKDVIWCNFNDLLVDEKGDTKKSMDDHLHPNDLGYETIVKELIPIIDNALMAPKGVAVKGRPTVKKESTCAQAATPTTFFAKSHWWKDRALQKRNEIVAGPKEYDIVFVGDSITHRWERKGGEGVKLYAELKKRYSILNLGYGGDRTQHVLWRMKYGELEGYKTKLFMLMIGTNNGGDKPEDIAEGTKRILEVIRAKHPQAKVLLLPIFPRGKTINDPNRKRNEAVNKITKAFADGENVIWVDFNNKLVDANGNTKKFMNDYLHTNSTGYAIWRDAVLPYFEKILGK